jgi:glycosyltransferase involved in cell wall biosynthesis
MQKIKIINKMLPITILIMSYNEEANIGFTLKSVIERFSQVIVVDSFSIDKTVEVCEKYPQVEVYHNLFTHWADQRNWMLDNCTIKNDWVFFLDADESINEKFHEELILKFSEINDDITSIFLHKDLYFLGQRLKYAYSHPKIRLIFRKDGLRYHAEGAREYATIDGKSLEVTTALIHEDRRPFDFWVRKHINNAEREKKLYFEKLNDKTTQNYEGLPLALRIRKYIRNNIWSKIPLGLRPFINFCYRYFIKLGILDGRAGLIYCLNHALWYEMLIDIKILETLRDEKP